jgi:hypothetical protein
VTKKFDVVENLARHKSVMEKFGAVGKIGAIANNNRKLGATKISAQQ